VPVLAVTLIVLGLRGRLERHRRIARWAWPIWMYVSVTGVVIYLLLYHLNPAPAALVRVDPAGPASLLGRPAADPAALPLAIENLNTSGEMRDGVEVEKPSGVGYLPGGRSAPLRADLLAAPSSARRPAGYQALTRRPRGVSEPGSDEVSEDA